MALPAPSVRTAVACGVAALAIAGCSPSATTPTTATSATGAQSQLGRVQGQATGLEATANMRIAETAMQSCGDGTTCTQAQLAASEPSLASAFALGARPGGLALVPLAGGGYRLLGYGGTQGGTAFTTYVLQHGADGSSQTSCSPPDPTACPNGRWPGGAG